ncbi:hypothetical protein AB6A40_006451 [Gnathostoma spinigerum]|uniref:Glycosyltransferase 2-like domain-containing protein n=1 Tax=Gnathostoma spinigerum TaxID=75299 RepID=A0ABD6EST2_9BILA
MCAADSRRSKRNISISAIVPVRNGVPWLSECLQSLLDQRLPSNVELEISVYNDGSTDGTSFVINEFSKKFKSKGFRFVSNGSKISNGVGFAKNRCVEQSRGEFICFCDADDISHPNRIRSQLNAIQLCIDPHSTIVGSRFGRIPENSTIRFSEWANSLSEVQLYTQIFTSNGPTLIAPTWFMSRQLYDRAGGFKESEKEGFPEDLQFFFDVYRLNCKFFRVDEELVTYRYHTTCASLNVSEFSIWKLRVAAFQEFVLNRWVTFSIWSVGKEGKRFFRSLSEENQRKVTSFCDIDRRKLLNGKFEAFDSKRHVVTAVIPVLPICQITPPVVVCVKLGITNGDLEELIALKNWVEGVDYYHFG